MSPSMLCESLRVDRLWSLNIVCLIWGLILWMPAIVGWSKSCLNFEFGESRLTFGWLDCCCCWARPCSRARERTPRRTCLAMTKSTAFLLVSSANDSIRACCFDSSFRLVYCCFFDRILIQCLNWARLLFVYRRCWAAASWNSCSFLCCSI